MMIGRYRPMSSRVCVAAGRDMAYAVAMLSRHRVWAREAATMSGLRAGHRAPGATHHRAAAGGHPAAERADPGRVPSTGSPTPICATSRPI